MQTGLLFIGGEYPPQHIIDAFLSRASLIVAADSGYDYLRNRGVDCDLVTGDMDSTAYAEEIASLDKNRVIRVQRDKDETDTEIGLRALHERGVDYPVIVGGGGGRLDHLLALAALFDRTLHPREWLLRGARAISVEERLTWSGLKGLTVSLFPAGAEPCTITSEGLKWPLDTLTWYRNRGDAGVSNEVTGDPLVLEPRTGRGILVIPNQDFSER